MIDEEYITCAAIWFYDGNLHKHQPKNIGDGFVICGHRHHNCYMTLKILNASININIEIQGFMTNKNRFVDRFEAAKLAYKVGQITKEIKQLHSEDIY